MKVWKLIGVNEGVAPTTKEWNRPMKTKTTKDPEQYCERRGELDVAAAERIRSGKATRVPPGKSVADRVARLQQESRERL